MTEPCEKHKVERCLYCFAHVPGSAAAPDWKCKAQRTADPPQDCDWPTCGCDPHADKVIEALQESGKLAAAPSGLGLREAVARLRDWLSKWATVPCGQCTVEVTGDGKIHHAEDCATRTLDFLLQAVERAALAAHPDAPPLTGDKLREIALKHRTVVAGYEFADKFDFDAIAAELREATPAQRTREQVRPGPNAVVDSLMRDWINSGRNEQYLRDLVREIVFQERGLHGAERLRALSAEASQGEK